MPREARKESSTGYYHIIMRGNNRSWIFSSEVYKTEFLNMLKEQEEDHLIETVAWCIMDNHVHIVLKSRIKEMSLAIKKINIKFAMKYNQKGKNTGHVFQDRFKSEPIETEKYLLQVVRYVHNNPVKAKIVKEVGDYKWSSYKNYLNEESVNKSRQMKLILSYFNYDIKELAKFHLKSDGDEYLEIIEDLEQYRLENAQYIISKYCNEKGIIDLRQIKANNMYMKELIIRLIKGSKLSLRKVANLLEISYNVVQALNQRDGK
ncbi:MAG: transposase [Epulopiscium sp.]|nr:transposase [Candidatus Epulonipiscium sp.]